MKKIIVTGHYNRYSDSYDMIKIDNKMYLSTGECVNCPEDATYNRDIHNSFSILRFTEKLFKEAGLNFSDYFEIVDDIDREN